MTSKKVIGIFVFVLLLGAVGAFFYLNKSGQDVTLSVKPTQEENKTSQNNEFEGEMYRTNLLDVTRGPILGVDTLRKSTGNVTVSDFPGDYSLTATFENLPDPKNTDFYEGWLVSSNPVAVISTGRAVKENGKYVNRFASSNDVSFYTMYVLTLEPDDNDPASAYHILEGTFK